LLGATGGARPTGLALVDALLLGLSGMAVAACARRARTVPVYVLAGVAAVLQPAAIPLALGLLGLVAALARRSRRMGPLAGLLAGGLGWAASVGAPFEPGARPIYLPLAAAVWVGVSARRYGSRRFRKRMDRVAAGAVGLATLGALLGLLAVVNSKAHLDRGADLLESGLAAARAGDAEGAVADLRAAERALARGESSLGARWSTPARLVPGVSQNVRALHDVVTEIRHLTAVGVTSAQEADLESLRVSAGRIDLDAVRAMEAPLLDVHEELRAVDRRIGDLDGQWLVRPIEQRVDRIQRRVADAVPSARLAVEGVRAAPRLLGGQGTRTYLVLFTTPVEARATTGFPGNYAEVTFTDGRLERTAFGRISDLNAAGVPSAARTLSGPEDYLRRYGRFDPASEWRSLTYSPDFPSIAQVAAELYPQSGGRAVDGVMSIDPVALAGLLNFTGPISVPGVAEPLGPDNAAEFLLLGQYLDLPDNPARIDALETLSDVAFDRLTTADLPGPAALRSIFGPIVEEGHLQVASFDASAAPFLDRLGMSGRLPEVEGDFVGVTTSNAAMSKIDLFLRRSLDYAVDWSPDTGEVQATATITLTNTAPASGLPHYVIGNSTGENRPGATDLPDGWHNVFVTLYSPWVPQQATLDGVALPLEVLPELDRNAISTFVELAPGQTRTITIELVGRLDERRYVLDVAAQPLVEPEQLSLRVRALSGPRLRATGPVELDGREASGDLPLVKDVRIALQG
jgi:hypothetical protein